MGLEAKNKTNYISVGVRISDLNLTGSPLG